MTLLVTGGNGFVMSHLVRHWLTAHPAERAIVLDSALPDAAVTSFLAPVADRVVAITGDVADAAGWEASLPRAEITRVVHGAAVYAAPIRRGGWIAARSGTRGSSLHARRQHRRDRRVSGTRAPCCRT